MSRLSRLSSLKRLSTVWPSLLVKTKKSCLESLGLSLILDYFFTVDALIFFLILDLSSKNYQSWSIYCQDDLSWYRLFRQPELIWTVDTIWISIDYQGNLDLSRIPRPPYLLKRLYKMSHSYCRNRHRRRYRHRTPSVANPFSKLLKSILFTNIQHLCRKNLSLSFDSNLIRYLDLDFCFAFLLFLSLSLYSCIAIFHRSVSLTTEQQMII